MSAFERHPFYGTAESLLGDAAEQLFAACGHPMFRTDMWDGMAASRLDRVATIGFSGSELRGAVIIGTSERLITKLHPLRGDGRELDYSDWLGELANQLAGRVKNKLHLYGVHLNLAMPMTIRGDNLRLRLNDQQVVAVSLSDGYAKAFAWIDALVLPGLQVAPIQGAEEPQAEGDLVLF